MSALPDAASDAAELNDAQPGAAVEALTTTFAGDGETEFAALEAQARAAAQVAATHADDVDRAARFPSEAVAALREQGLLGAMVPRAFGGHGASLRCLAQICETLAQACASTAMIYAMHQIQVACVLEHAPSDAWHQQLLQRLTGEQLLLASATSEDTVGGNLRNSACAVQAEGNAFSLEKLASTISYGAYADGILVTARRNNDAPPSDQVLITILKSDYTLERRSGWDSLGMRGTCSEAFKLIAKGGIEQVLPTPFAEIADRTMLPVSHVLWASCWIGIAANAVDRAKQFFRVQAKAKPGTLPPGGTRLAESVGLLQLAHARLTMALDSYAQARRSESMSESMSETMAFASDMNLLKTSVSTTAIAIVGQVLMICGMAGYKNGTPFSVGRHLRDLHSAPLMINNDRIAANTASLLLAQRSTTLRF
ncbi:Acyl-CoA dehydrogenase [Pararobbsia alpina]|uniref:acyl-CoA dehydrogenase family protein n=1 Tax=Pararobbsia alpina TaxID=621374 RepID=UPI0039A55F9A